MLNDWTYLCLNDGVNGRRLHTLGQKLADRSQPEQLNRERQLVQRRPKHLRRHMLIQAIVSRPRDQMKSESGTHTARPPPPLLQVGLARPHRGVVGHVVVRREELHLHLAAVDDVHYVVNGDGRLGDVGGEDDLGDGGGCVVEGGPLVLARKLGVEGDDTVAGGIAEGGMLQFYQACPGYRTLMVEDSPDPDLGHKDKQHLNCKLLKKISNAFKL
jgi:hypothetical protein